MDQQHGQVADFPGFHFSDMQQGHDMEHGHDHAGWTYSIDM
jgi:hypothetical protein